MIDWLLVRIGSLFRKRRLVVQDGIQRSWPSPVNHSRPCPVGTLIATRLFDEEVYLVKNWTPLTPSEFRRTFLHDRRQHGNRINLRLSKCSQHVANVCQFPRTQYIIDREVIASVAISLANKSIENSTRSNRIRD